MERKVTRGYGILESFLSKQRSKVANKLIPAPYRKGRILDIGCGTYSLFLKDTEFCEKYGIDKVVTEGQKDHFQKYNINLINIDFEKKYLYNFESDFFDVVTMLAVFEHIEKKNLKTLLKEIYRVLKPGGMYIITTPAVWTNHILNLMAKLRLVSSVEIEEHKGAYNHYEIYSLLLSAGFSEEKLKLGYFEMFMNTWATGSK